MQRKIAVVMLLLLVVIAGAAVAENVRTASGKGFHDSLTLLDEHFAAANFAEGVIHQSDLDKILHAGLRAPSAGNRQPWRFIVVRDVDIMKQINLPHPLHGNIIIVVVMPNSSRSTPSEAHFYDAACASMAMYYAAEALGYGARIYTGQISLVNNARNSAAIGIAKNESAVAFVRIGKYEANEADAVTHASQRNTANAVVTYK